MKTINSLSNLNGIQIVLPFLGIYKTEYIPPSARSYGIILGHTS